MPAAWAIRPQLGSRPKSAVLTSGELAIARATRSASAAEAAPLDLDPADPGGALAVGDDLDRELEQDGLEQALGKRRAGGAGRLQEHGVVGAHLAVDGDPLEGGADRGAQRRVGILDDGVGLDEAEHRREARLIIPAPFAWAERVTPPARTVQLFGQRSVVRIASEKAVAPSAESAPAASPIPARTASIGSGTPIIPVSATATSSGRQAEPRRRLARTSPRRRRSPARRSRRWRCRR